MEQQIQQTKRIAAVAIIENTEKQLLLLNRNYEPFGFCLPGGKIDLLKESVIEGLIREIKEEIGIGFLITNFTYQGEYQSIKGIDVHVFKCNIPLPALPKISSEHSAYLFTSSLEGIPIAGNTKEFLSSYQFDSQKIDYGYIFNFGKYNEKPLHLIVKHDPQYILWCENNTQHKFTKKVLDEANNNINLQRKELEALHEYQNDQEQQRNQEKYESNQRKENLQNARTADGFGNVVDIGQGRYQQIDSEGNANGKIVEWYYGWSEPDSEDF